ncbi:MAG: anti-sigma factor [Rhizobiaceae bacterium]
MSDAAERLARAGDHVLGLLDEAETARIEADMRTDPLLREAVDAFAARMAALDMTARPEAVAAGMWERIAARIAETAQEPAVDTGRVLAFPAAKARGRLGGRLALAASLAAALGVGYLGGWLTARPPAAPVVVVILDTPQNTPGAVFEAYADNSVRILPLEDFAVPAGKIMQVWTLYDQAVGPVSLGTLARSEVVVLGGRSLPAPEAEQLYEITLEPAPGSPTGKPTGPILVKGFAKRPPV